LNNRNSKYNFYDILYLSKIYYNDPIFKLEIEINNTEIIDKIDAWNITSDKIIKDITLVFLNNFSTMNKDTYSSFYYYFLPFAHYINDCSDVKIFNDDDDDKLNKFLSFVIKLTLLYELTTILHKFKKVVKQNEEVNIVKDVLDLVNLYILSNNYTIEFIINYKNQEINMTNFWNKDLFKEFYFKPDFDDSRNYESIIVQKFTNKKRAIDDYIIQKEFYYKYPKFLFMDYQNYDILLDFIKFHIFDLFKPENQKYRFNLIKFHIELWWDKILFKKEINNNDTTLDHVYNTIISNIYFLLYKKYNFYNKKNYNKVLKDFKIKSGFNTPNEMYEYIIKNIIDNNTLIDMSYIFINNIKKMLKIDEESNEDNIIIDKINYVKATFTHDIFINFIDNNNNDEFYINSNIFNSSDTVFNDEMIYKFYIDKYIKFRCNITKISS
jgi:hypothetical protein